MKAKCNLQNIIDQQSLNWIFVGGKGGVGKTTISSSLAIQLSQSREKVLIISTDPAHNLSDAFDQKLGSSPTPIKGFNNLFGLEIDPTINDDHSNLQEVLGFAPDSSTMSILSELNTSIPGIDEAMCLAYIMKIVDQMDFHCVVFDTAPTGHTLRLLSFPNVLGKALEKLIQLKENLGGVLSSVGNLFSQNPEALFDRIFKSMDNLKTNIERINREFKDTSKTTFVAVCIPEFLSMYETERLTQELYKNEIDIRNIVVNQVLFEEGHCNMCKSRIKMQKKYLDQIRDLFDDFHITIIPLQEQEVRGFNDLSNFSKMLLAPPEYKY